MNLMDFKKVRSRSETEMRTLHTSHPVLRMLTTPEDVEEDRCQSGAYMALVNSALIKATLCVPHPLAPNLPLLLKLKPKQCSCNPQSGSLSYMLLQLSDIREKQETRSPPGYQI